jgi:predicted porin
MKKTLIASAVAAATLSTSVLAMDPASELAARLDSMPSVYGNIQLLMGYEDTQTGSGYGFTDHADDSGYGMADNGSTIGFKHSHEISPGLEGFFKAEFHFDADDQKGNGGLGEKFDEAYIGLKGGFGKVQFGSDDTVYEWVDVTDHFESYSTPTEIDVTGEDNQIQYVSPDMSGLQLGLTLQVNGEDSQGNNHRNGLQVAAKYEKDGLGLVAAIDTAEGDVGGNNSTVYAVGVSYAKDAFKVAASFETQEDNVDVISVLGTFSAGANTFAAAYSFVDHDSGGETSQISLQALHNLSDNMYVYVEGYMMDHDGPEDNLLYVGATYAF